MKKANVKKITVLAVSLLLIVALGITGAVMFLTDLTEELENTFIPTEVTCEVDEDFDGETKSDVTVKCTSEIDAYLRAAIIVNWVDANGNVLGEEVPESAYTISRTSGKWVLEDDGYYYYTDRVAPGGETENLIDECKLVLSAVVPDGAYLSVTVLASAIQADPVQARKDAGWVIK